jgi:hypothetical protein
MYQILKIVSENERSNPFSPSSASPLETPYVELAEIGRGNFEIFFRQQKMGHRANINTRPVEKKVWSMSWRRNGPITHTLLTCTWSITANSPERRRHRHQMSQCCFNQMKYSLVRDVAVIRWCECELLTLAASCWRDGWQNRDDQGLRDADHSTGGGHRCWLRVMANAKTLWRLMISVEAIRIRLKASAWDGNVKDRVMQRGKVYRHHLPNKE